MNVTNFTDNLPMETQPVYVWYEKGTSHLKSEATVSYSFFSSVLITCRYFQT